LLTDIDPTLPTETELNMQMFTTDGVEIIEGSDDLDTLEVGYFMCKKCEHWKFVDYSAYKSHMVAFHHLNFKETHTCDTCFATFVTIKEYSKHQYDNVHLGKYH
jgi:DNA replicative helicase MCM subunit Mcm2 (Cdc46/Mcm family)